MKSYQGKEEVEPGLYFATKELRFVSMDDAGALPGEKQERYVKLPALAMLVIGPVLGLVFAVFLPLVGFLMLGGLVGRKLGGEVLRAGEATMRLIAPRAVAAHGPARPPAPAAPAVDRPRGDEAEPAARPGEQRR